MIEDFRSKNSKETKEKRSNSRTLTENLREGNEAATLVIRNAADYILDSLMEQTIYIMSRKVLDTIQCSMHHERRR